MQEVIERVANTLCGETCDNKEYSAIYKAHKYWARKPWYIVEKYIKKYSQPGELVFDPFCGSGCTGLEAVINGRNFLGQDLNPSALHVSKGTLNNKVTVNALKEDFEAIAAICKNEILSLYEVDDVCPRCGNKMVYKYVNNGPKFSNQNTAAIYCPVCNKKAIKRDLTNEEVKKTDELNASIVVDKWTPTVKFPEKFYKDRFSYKGISSVADMYTKRNWYALSILYDAINTVVPKAHVQLVLIAFTNTVLHVSKLKGENVRPLGVNNYWVPDDYYEENVWFRFDERFKNLIKSKTIQYERAECKKEQDLIYGKWDVKKKSALKSMGEDCVDYVFTDPPYGEAIQYSELSFMWNAWLDEEYVNKEEIIINPVQKKGEQEFSTLLNCSLKNIYLALKKDHYFTLCFQNKNSSVWKSVILYCKKLGFKLVDVSIYDTFGSPFNKSWANFSPKSDIYVTFKKASVEDVFSYNQAETIDSIILEVSAYMRERDIPFNNNRLYDLTISYLIWAIFSNQQEIDVENFNIETFATKCRNLHIS